MTRSWRVKVYCLRTPSERLESFVTGARRASFATESELRRCSVTARGRRPCSATDDGPAATTAVLWCSSNRCRPSSPVNTNARYSAMASVPTNNWSWSRDRFRCFLCYWRTLSVVLLPVLTLWEKKWWGTLASGQGAVGTEIKIETLKALRERGLARGWSPPQSTRKSGGAGPKLNLVYFSRNIWLLVTLKQKWWQKMVTKSANHSARRCCWHSDA